MPHTYCSNVDVLDAAFERDLDSMGDDELKLVLEGLVEQLKSRATQEAVSNMTTTVVT